MPTGPPRSLASRGVGFRMTEGKGAVVEDLQTEAPVEPLSSTVERPAVTC